MLRLEDLYLELPNFGSDTVLGRIAWNQALLDRSLEGGATGQASSIIKVGLDASIEIIRK